MDGVFLSAIELALFPQSRPLMNYRSQRGKPGRPEEKPVQRLSRSMSQIAKPIKWWLSDQSEIRTGMYKQIENAKD